MERFIYKYVAIVGLDGMGIFDLKTDTPNFDRIFDGYAVSHSSLSLYPTISAQNWGAMLIGATPDVHGINNGIASTEHYSNKNLPTVFSSIREKMPEAKLCSVCHWSPINYGIVEEGIGIDKQNCDTGDETTKTAVAYLEKQIPTLLFVHIDNPDHGGHACGYGTNGHLKEIRDSDRMTGEIFDAYERAGVLDDTLFITITDHGGFINSHGGYTDGEKYIFFALRGKTVNKTDSFFAETKDINAIVRYALGMEIPQYDINGYSSQIPEGIFCDCNMPYIPEEPHEAENGFFNSDRFDVENKETPDINSENGLYHFFSPDDISFALFLDGNTDDATGKVKFREEGLVKFYSDGVRGKRGEFGTTGCLVADDFNFGKNSFSVSAWLNLDDVTVCPCWYLSTKPMSASGQGFSLGYNFAFVYFGIETDDPDSYLEEKYFFGCDFTGGWANIVAVVDKEEMKAYIYVNFELKLTVDLPEIFDFSVDGLPLTIGEDGAHTCNSTAGATFRIDDVIAFNRALKNDDIQNLKNYYNL